MQGSRSLEVTMRVAFALLALGAVLAGPLYGEPSIRGAWRPELYVLKDGSSLPVTGRIFFGATDWTVLFFVMEGEEPKRGSGEGGTYRLDGDRLEFTHLYHLSAGEAVGTLPEAPLRMAVNPEDEASREPCRVEIGEETMTIYFPSGNEMRFRRSP